MPKPLAGIDPVAIALDTIEDDGGVRMTGVDLETGTRVSVRIERQADDRCIATARHFAASGLVLTLTVQDLSGGH